MRVVALGSTFYFAFTSRAYSTGAPTALAGTPDLSVVEENSGTVIDTGATVATGHASVTGLNLGTIVATTGNGYEYGKVYSVYIDTGTVDSVSAVGEVVYEFRVETAAEEAIREANEALYKTSTVATVTSNDTSTINMADFWDANTANGAKAGTVLAVQDSTDDSMNLVVVTANTGTLATVQLIGDGGAMDFTVAAGDKVWYVGTMDMVTRTNAATLVTRITSTLFSGITSMAEWLGLIAGKQTGNTTARTELRSTGAGSGTFDETTDSMEATRDHIGDGTNFATAISEAVMPASGEAFTVLFKMVDATDGYSPETGLTVSATVDTDDGGFGAATNSVTEVGNGWYSLVLTAGEMTGSRIIVNATATGARPADRVIYTTAAV